MAKLNMSVKEKYLGEFEQMAMLAIIQLGDDAYGATIRKRLLDAVDRDVKVGALYVTLDRLEGKGMLVSRTAEPSASRGGKPKRYFKVTAKGEAALKRVHQALETLWQPVIAMK